MSGMHMCIIRANNYLNLYFIWTWAAVADRYGYGTAAILAHDEGLTQRSARTSANDPW